MNLFSSGPTAQWIAPRAHCSPTHGLNWSREPGNPPTVPETRCGTRGGGAIGQPPELRRHATRTGRNNRPTAVVLTKRRVEAPRLAPIGATEGRTRDAGC